MRRKSFNIPRMIRLQLKTGYMVEEPEAYTFMRRYPPIIHKRAPLKKVVGKSFPTMEFYEKAIERNPMLQGENVYPAFWQQEPLAMTLAKKQYEFVQHGFDEDTAYKGALEFVEKLESKSYEQLKSVVDEVQSSGAATSFASDPDVAAEIQRWRNRLNEVFYKDMDLAEKGELDYFIQTKILGWEEVARERRMKDPVFAAHFDKLRDGIFPQKKISDRLGAAKVESLQKQKLIAKYGVSVQSISPTERFYYDDYMIFFEKLRQQPLLAKWSSNDREELSRWVLNTLACKHIRNASGSATRLSKYLDRLRAQFFPMVRAPERAAEFNLPPIDKMKEILHSNDVGYLTEQGSLYVKRFYKIPLVLFPMETLTTSIILDLKDRNHRPTDADLKKGIASLDLKDAQALNSAKRDVVGYFRSSSPKAGGRPDVDTNKGTDGAFFDKLLNDSFGGDSQGIKGGQGAPRSAFAKNVKEQEDEEAKALAEQTARAERGIAKMERALRKWTVVERERSLVVKAQRQQLEKNKAHILNREKDDPQTLLERLEQETEFVERTSPHRDVAREEISILDSEERLIQFRQEDKAEEGDAASLSPVEHYIQTGDTSRLADSQKRMHEISKHFKLPSTPLEQDRDEYFKQQSIAPWWYARTEEDIKIFKRLRVDQHILERARLAIEFEGKDSARRAKEWKERKDTAQPKLEGYRPPIDLIGPSPNPIEPYDFSL